MRDDEKLPLPAGLRARVLARINSAELRRARAFLIASAPTVALSLVGIVWSVAYVFSGLRESNFFTYLSFIVSDPDVVFAYWKEFLVSLADTIPLIEVTLSLIAVAVFLVSIKTLAKSLRGGLVFSLSH